jgi:hypothetical protein
MSLAFLRKLSGRSATELRERASQNLSKWLERRGLTDSGEPTPDHYASLFQPFEGPAVCGPFFSSFEDRAATLRALQSLDPEHATLRERADRVLVGRYDLLGYRELSFGEPIDWRLEPQSGVRAPDIHWSRIAFLDPAVVGDHKLIWELGRHRAFVTLAQAWWCTRDPRYAEGLAGLLLSWLDANPPKRGVHWVSSLELAFRSIAWTWMLALAGDVLNPALQRRAMAHLVMAGRHIERYLSTWFSPNTHLTGEALGLFVLGTAFPQCVDAARWREHGSAILLEWLSRHVRADGTYVEQSTWYHRYTTDFYLQYFVLAGRAGSDLRMQVGSRLEGLLEVLAWISRPDGSMPLVGDDDGGRLLFLDERTANNVRSPLAVGAVLFGRGDFGHVAGPASAELVWLLGAEGLVQYSRLRPEVPSTASRAFVESGTCVIRTGWSSDSSVLVVDGGPHGFLNSGHSHADALSVDLSVRGLPLLVDPGTFTYTASSDWRNRFRETAAHNAATVDGCGSATPAGPFQWLSRAEARVDAWYDGGSVVLFRGAHDGFERLRPAIAYRRTIVAIVPDVWIIRDEIRGEGNHELAIHFQCAVGVGAEIANGRAVLDRNGATVATIQADATDGEWSLQQGWVSSEYGVRHEAPHLRFLRTGSGFVAVTTVVSSGIGSGIRFNPGSGADAPVVMHHGDDRYLLLTEWTRRPSWLESDARVALLSMRAGAPDAELVAAALSHLSLDRIAAVGTPVPGAVIRVPAARAASVFGSSTGCGSADGPTSSSA